MQPSDLHRHLIDLLWSKEGTDVVIELGNDGEAAKDLSRREEKAVAMEGVC